MVSKNQFIVISSEKPRYIVQFLHAYVMVERNKLNTVIRRSLRLSLVLCVMCGLAAAARVPGLLYVKREWSALKLSASRVLCQVNSLLVS